VVLYNKARTNIVSAPVYGWERTEPRAASEEYHGIAKDHPTLNNLFEADPREVTDKRAKFLRAITSY